jgi:hypothetical protein
MPELDPMRPWIIIVLSTLAAATGLIAAGQPQPPAAAQPPAGNAAPLRVGTWNIEWLGRPERRASKVPQAADDVAKYVRASGADVLALNEISQTNDGPAPSNRTLAEAADWLARETGQPWKHMLFPKEDPADRDQYCGVLWNAGRLTLVSVPWKVPVRRGPEQAELWRRHPYAVKFSTGEGRTDLVLIPVHMKSNVGGEAATGRQRDAEAKALVRVLGTVQNQLGDDDVMVLGDCNCKTADELALRRYTAAGLRDLNAGDQLTWIKSARHDSAPFDRILVPDDQPEFAGSTVRVVRASHLGNEENFRRLLSDHYMLVTDVRVMTDDD